MKSLDKRIKDEGIIAVPYTEADYRARGLAVPQAQKNDALTIVTADRHLQIIAKWEKAGHITMAEAAKLRQDTISRVTVRDSL